MRRAIVLFALSIAICGCDKRDEQPRLEPLARGLAEAWQPVALDMKLDVHPEANGDQVTMRCVLRNMSANEIDVDQESLPWNNSDAFSISAVAADGKVIQQKPVSVPAVVARISAPHAPVPLASGESIEGRMNMGLMRMDNIPVDEDLLILWSYLGLKDWRSDAHDKLSGITLLKARLQPQAPVLPKAKPDSSISGTSVPTQEMKQDLRNAPKTLVIANAVIRLMAFPLQDRMPMAVSRDPNTGLTVPHVRPVNLSFRLISEDGRPLPRTLRVRAVWMVQDGQIWNTSAIEETVGESGGSSRDFLVHDGPLWRSIPPLTLS
jgi:hypothetical protein